MDKKFFCDRCLNHFKNLYQLQSHVSNCYEMNRCVIEMPPEDDCIIRFNNFKNQLQTPFIIYADIETLLKKPDNQFCTSSSTKAYQQHEAYSIGLLFKCRYDDSKTYYKSFRGKDCIKQY